MPKTSTPQLVVALDNHSVVESLQIVDELKGVGVRWFKVGLELYALAGPQIVFDLKKSGLSVFLDLKLHDIPNTVAKTVAALAHSGADLLTVHCAGGAHMLKEAGLAAAGSPLKLVGVTVLTSTDTSTLDSFSKMWGARNTVDRSSLVSSFAGLAADAGLSGIVCSVPDLQQNNLKQLHWSSPVFVTPGIRGATDSKNDQISTATAAEAVLAGATHLVVGRPITSQPKEKRAIAAQAFLSEIRGK